MGAADSFHASLLGAFLGLALCLFRPIDLRVPRRRSFRLRCALMGIRISGTLLFALVGAVAVLASCGGPATCVDGVCECDEGSTCELPCDAPPCSVRCAPHSSCTASCANGTCTCNSTGDCTF